MEFKEIISFADDKPSIVDFSSSKTMVYVRRNIRSVPNKDNDGNETEGTHWIMEEAKIPKSDNANVQMAVFELLESTLNGIDDVMANILLNQMEAYLSE